MVRYSRTTPWNWSFDDGHGPMSRAMGRGRGAGHGLVGMRERVALYGGTAGGRPPGNHDGTAGTGYAVPGCPTDAGAT